MKYSTSSGMAEGVLRGRARVGYAARNVLDQFDEERAARRLGLDGAAFPRARLLRVERGHAPRDGVIELREVVELCGRRVAQARYELASVLGRPGQGFLSHVVLAYFFRLICVVSTSAGAVGDAHGAVCRRVSL